MYLFDAKTTYQRSDNSSPQLFAITPISPETERLSIAIKPETLAIPKARA